MVTVNRQKQQIFRTVILLGKASLLMIKKVEVMSQAIEKLTEDQAKQQEVFQNMIGCISVLQKD